MMKMKQKIMMIAALCSVLGVPVAQACEQAASGRLLCPDTSLPALREAGGRARRAGDSLLAEQVFRLATGRYPKVPAVSLDLAVVLVDQQKYTEAAGVLAKHRRRFGESEAYWLTQAYLYEAQGRFFDSMDSYDRVLLINPANREARRQKIHAIDTLGMPDKALELAAIHPDALTGEDWLRLRMDSAAYAVRMAVIEDDDRVRRQQAVRHAIRLSDEALAFQQQHFPERRGAGQQTRFDRLLVWGLDSRHREVLDEYAVLKQENAVFREDVRAAVAQSALHLEQPDVAIEVLEPLGNSPAVDINARLLLFYAYIEHEDFAQAQQAIDTIVHDEPPLLYGQSDRVTGTNWNRVDADTNQLMLAAWGNDLDKALAGMQGYVDKAPFNVHLRADLAGLHYLRGWPRSSLSLYKEVEMQQPGLYSVKSGFINAWWDLYDFVPAENMTHSLVRDYPELKATETHAEDLAIHNMQELNVTVGLGRSDDDYQGSRDLEAEVWWYSRPLDYSNRLFLHTTSKTGEFDEGNGQIDRYGIGWEQRVRYHDYTFRNTVEINSSYASDADTGIAFTSDWGIDDHWSVQGAYESFSSHLPVRAYNDGVTASSVELAAQYRVDEGEYYRTSLASVDFSDGNDRLMWNATGYQVFYSRPHHQWAVIESLYASTNSETDGMYFSPDNDAAAGLALEYQGIIERDYDFEFRHKLLLGAGVYNQENYGSDQTAELDYRHIWQKDKTLSWFYGVGFGYHPYDGDGEFRKSLFGGFEWRFD